MSEVVPFQFPATGQPVRTLTINGSPWIVAADVAKVLRIGNVHSSLALLDDDERGVHSMETPSGLQPMAIVSESGFYSLVLRSRKQEAKAFRRWVTGEVLPSIRRTGSYSLPGSGVVPITLTFPEAATLIRQHWGLAFGEIGLRKALRSAGVLKQGSSDPRRAYEEWFWLTETAWLIYPHALPLLVRKIVQGQAEPRRNPFIQTRLDIDGSELELLAG